MALVSIVHFNGGKETGRCCLTFMKHFDLCFDTSMGSFSEEAVALVWYRDCDKYSSVLLNLTMWPLVYGSRCVGAHVGPFSSMMMFGEEIGLNSQF